MQSGTSLQAEDFVFLLQQKQPDIDAPALQQHWQRLVRPCIFG